MEFAALDDDLFREERPRNNADEDYSARFCEKCWFLDVPPGTLVSDEDRLSVQKHCADYMYFKKDFSSAIVKYTDILSIIPQGNTTVRRECYEGIARSCIKTGNFTEAFEFAKKLHATSKTIEQNTVSCSVVIDTGIASGKFFEALKAAQLLVSLHPFNSRAWLKLARCYACLYGIQLPSMKDSCVVMRNEKSETINPVYQIESVRRETRKSPECESMDSRVTCDSDSKLVNNGHCNVEPKLLSIPLSIDSSIKLDIREIESGDFENIYDYWRVTIKEPMEFTDIEKGTQFVCACLYRSFMMLKRTESTTFGFALDSSLSWQDIIWKDMKATLEEKSLNFVIFAVGVSDDIYSSNSPLKESSSEFVDRGSSKFKNEDTGDVEIISNKSFEKQWFKWIK